MKQVGTFKGKPVYEDPNAGALGTESQMTGSAASIEANTKALKKLTKVLEKMLDEFNE